MTMRSVNPEEFGLNGQLYRLASPVRRFDAAQQPGKVSLGEHSDETNPWTSTVTQQDLRDGIGIYIMNPTSDLTRAWWGDVQLRHRGNIVLPRLAITTTASSTDSDIQAIEIFGETIYSFEGTAVHVYSAPSDSWGASVRTLLNSVTDTAVGLVGGTETLVAATGSEVDYATNSTTWARNTTDIKFVVFHRDLLWGIDNAGQLYYTDDLSAAWTADAVLQLPAGYVTGLEIHRTPTGERALYAITRVGPYIHDSQNQRFLKTDLELPYHPDSGDSSTVWNRGPMFISAGNAIYSFQAGRDATIVNVMGPDRDDGLPASRRGVVRNLLTSHNDMIAVIDPTSSIGQSELAHRGSGGMGSSRFSTFGAGGGEASILGWDERGWEVKWASNTTARKVTAAKVGYAHNAYRLWWAHNKRVLYMDQPIEIVNPRQISTQRYATSGTLELPWFDAGVSNQEKLGLSVFIDSTHPTSSETIKIEYATNLVETFTTLATKSATGQTEYTLPDSSDVTGVDFRYWKFKLTFARGNTNTNSPILHKLYLVYRKRVTPLWGGTVLLDISETHNGVPPNQQVKNLETARYTNTLVEATWVDDSSTGNPQNYYVDVLQVQFVERGGHEPPETAILTLVEPRQSTSR